MYTGRNKSFLSSLNASNSHSSNEGWKATLHLGPNNRFFNISGNAVLSQDSYGEDLDLEAKEQYTCGVSEDLLQDYVDSELDELTALRVDRHLVVCKRCELICRELTDLKKLASSLNQTMNIEENIHARLRTKLIEELNIDIDRSVEEEL